MAKIQASELTEQLAFKYNSQLLLGKITYWDIIIVYAWIVVHLFSWIYLAYTCMKYMHCFESLIPLKNILNSKDRVVVRAFNFNKLILFENLFKKIKTEFLSLFNS